MSAARLVPVVRSRVATSAAPASVTLRSISTTARLQKGPVDVTKDTLKAADRVVSDAAVKGIDLGRMFIPPLAIGRPNIQKLTCIIYLHR